MDEEQPKKYIRTFAGDIKIVQEGGKPDLAPLAEPSARERLVAASPVVAPHLPIQEKEAPSIAPPVYTPPLPVKPTPIKTYAGDFSDRVKEGNASFATILAAEQDSRPSVVEKEKPKFSRSGILYTIEGSVLLIAGIAGASIAYMRYQAATAPVIPASTVSAPIFVDEQEQISGIGQALFQAIEQSSTRPITSGTVRLLSFATGSTSSPQAISADTSIFSALRTSAPDILLRNVNAVGSMAGIVSAPSTSLGTGGGQSPFFILSVASYSQTFAGMLQWERSMPRDFENLFPPYAESPGGQASSTIATSTSTPSVQLVFRDEVVGNHDVRVYRDALGRSIFLYGYWNQTTLIIARDPSAFTEILERLATSRT